MSITIMFFVPASYIYILIVIDQMRKNWLLAYSITHKTTKLHYFPDNGNTLFSWLTDAGLFKVNFDMEFHREVKNDN